MTPELLRAIASGSCWISDSHEIGAFDVNGTTTPAAMAAEIERLRGLVDGARFFLGEDMQSCAYIMLCGRGLEGGIDPTLEHTAAGRALIEEGCDERDVIEAARALVATMTTDTPPDGGTRWQEARVLREALAKLGDPR